MALTMTRTRTQTALSSLVLLVANVHGELAFVEGQQADASVRLAAGGVKRDESAEAASWKQAALERRRAALLVTRDALYVTLRQFDPTLDPTTVGTAEDWLKPFGQGMAAKRRYLAQMPASQT
jgi:hypothetical protein